MSFRDWEHFAEDDGVYAIAVAIMRLSQAIDRLGNADAATPMGAIEAFGKHIGEKLDMIADAMGNRP
jgi:hypothetical protein